MDTNLLRKPNETKFEWKLRCCKAKINRETELNWEEISNLLNLRMSGDHLRKTAYGMVEYDKYIHGFQGVTTTILSISDLHIPFQLPISTFKEYIGKIDILQLNGDIVDCQALSKFTKQYRLSPMEEIIQGRQYIIELIDYLQPKEVVCNYGNHDKRFINYFAKKLDTDILELMPDTSLELIFVDGFNHYSKKLGTKTWYEPLYNVYDKKIKIKYINDWKSKIGKTWFAHPLIYRNGTCKTAEKTMDFLLRTERESFDTVVLAHTHSIGDTKKGFIRLIEQGTCANIDKLNYANGRLVSPSKQGFAIICQDKEGSIIQDKSKIICLN